jgi:DNA-binding NtrC family response regulator
MAMPRDLLFVGAERETRALAEGLAPRWHLCPAAGAEQAREWLRQSAFPVGLADLDSLEPSGEALLGTAPGTRWIALVGPGSPRQRETGRLIAQTCFDYHTRPLDLDHLDRALGHALGMARLDRHLQAPDPGTAAPEMVGASPPIRQVFQAIRKMAGVEAPVMILGESGTGKELAARAIHQRSERAGGPFIPVNCGALPPDLVQAELFGNEKGAFTGAYDRRVGHIEAAHGGTLFLDEVGDLPLELQVNLLRFLQAQTIQRVGGIEEIPLDVRVVAATHEDLEACVAEGRFREDLYYRLQVLPLRMPALRERGKDIERLARFYFERFARERPVTVNGFSEEALAVMRRYDWPGNIREMINRVRRAIVMSENRLIFPTDLGLDQGAGGSRVRTLAQARARAEEQAVRSALRHSGNNISQAARLLGVTRPTLYRLMEAYGLEA